MKKFAAMILSVIAVSLGSMSAASATQTPVNGDAVCVAEVPINGVPGSISSYVVIAEEYADELADADGQVCSEFSFNSASHLISKTSYTWNSLCGESGFSCSGMEAITKSDSSRCFNNLGEVANSCRTDINRGVR